MMLILMIFLQMNKESATVPLCIIRKKLYHKDKDEKVRQKSPQFSLGDEMGAVSVFLSPLPVFPNNFLQTACFILVIKK